MRTSFFKLTLLLVVLAVCGNGCFYFNLFYNAQSAFDDAYRAHRKVMDSYPDSSFTPAQDIIANYKRCVEKCEKVFEEYPKAKKWHDKTLYLMGKALYYSCEYDRAIRIFAKIQKEYPQSEYVGESFLFIGKSYLKNGNLDEAEKIFAAAVEQYPVLNKNHEVDILSADISIQRNGKAKAIGMLEAAYASVHDTNRKMEIAAKIAQLYRDLKLYDKAITVLENAPHDKKAIDLLFRIDFLCVICYVDKGLYQDALDRIAVMIDTKPYVSHMAVLLLQKADALDKSNKTAEAIDVYLLITSAYTTSDVVGNAWYQLGCIYQIKKNDPKKAKEYFDKATQTAKDEMIKKLAGQRSAAIEQIEKISSGTTAINQKGVMKPDTVKTPSEYRIGELYWLELDQPDSAFEHFCAMTNDTANRAMLPKALYSASWIARFALYDTLKADSIYMILQKKFPTDSFTRKAQEAKGIPVSFMTRLDSAYKAFQNAEQLYFDANTPEEAVDAYVNVFTLYHETIYGPKSLYAAAWIDDFVLDKNKSAKKLYELLCDSCPKSPYCNDAKPRLKTVMDTLARLKILKKISTMDSTQTAIRNDKTSQDAVRDKSMAVAPADSIHRDSVKIKTEPPKVINPNAGYKQGNVNQPPLIDTIHR